MSDSMKPTKVLSTFFGMKEPADLDGYTNADGTAPKSKLQAFAAELKRLSAAEKTELVTAAAAELGVEVDPA